MTFAIYTKSEIDTNYLVLHIRVYFLLGPEAKIRLGSFIVRNLVSDVLNAAKVAIPRPPSTPELAAALALLDQKYSVQSPELLHRLWTLASVDPPPIVHSTPSIVVVDSNNSPDPTKRQRTTAGAEYSSIVRGGSPFANEPPRSSTTGGADLRSDL